MAFLGTLSKDVAETIPQTNEAAGTSKLDLLISEEEKAIANQYSQIGKLYVSLHRTDYEEEFAGMMASIAEAEAKIKGYKSQIQDVKGIRNCENCGAEVEKSAVFCTSCGATMEVVKCSSCGMDIRKGVRFCTFCGKRIQSGTVSPVGDVQKIVCPNCGAKMEDSVAFCTECGTKLKGSRGEDDLFAPESL